MTNVLRRKNVAKVAVLLGGIMFICVVVLFSGIDNATSVNEVYKQDVVEDDDVDGVPFKPVSRHGENYLQHYENKRRRDISQGKSMVPQKLIIGNGNGSRIDHEKREAVKEVNEHRLWEI